MVERGFAFKWDSGGNGEHTWIVLTHIFDDDKVIVANISSYKIFGNDRTLEFAHNDLTCLLESNTIYRRLWQFKSFVNYRKARIECVNDLKSITLDQSHFTCRWPVHIVDRMAAGLSLSKYIPQGIKKAYEVL